MTQLSPDSRAALALLHTAQPRIYLGARYGLTPQTYISPEKAHAFLGMNTGRKVHEPFCDVARMLAKTIGLSALKQAFAEKYEEMEDVAPEAREELSLIEPIATGKVLVTGSYSSDLVANFSRLTTAFDDSGVSNIRLDLSNGRNAYLITLHGWRANPAGALVSREEVDAFDQERKGISTLVRGLLHEKPWIVLGCDGAEDATFLRLCSEVCRELGLGQRPIYVIDPRESEILFFEWPRDPLRHIRMRPLEFLRALEAHRPQPGPPSAPGPSEPPPPPADTGSEGEEAQSASGEEVPGPTRPAGSSSGSPRGIEIVTLDNRVFHTTVPGNMRVSTLAAQFVRRHVHGDQSSARRERGVVDIESGDDNWDRVNGNATIDEAGIKAGDRLRIYSDTVAGATRREELLNDIQLQLEGLAAHDRRVEVRPNLPGAADRYEITLHCGGWGPPESAAEKPYRTDRQEILLEYPAEFPDAPPLVWWDSKIFHPNVSQKNGFVCLGALQESFTPLFGPRELIHMLIEVSEYRNYELDGVLNREAAIFAQLHPELITEHGGWAYQPTLEEKGDKGEQILEFVPNGTGVRSRRSRKP